VLITHELHHLLCESLRIVICYYPDSRQKLCAPLRMLGYSQANGLQQLNFCAGYRSCRIYKGAQEKRQ
jgi:hypothetical protein